MLIIYIIDVKGSLRLANEDLARRLDQLLKIENLILADGRLGKIVGAEPDYHIFL